MERFATLLEELGIELETTLHPDVKGACLLVIDEKRRVQLECHPQRDRLLMATFVCETPAGRYRENILKDALKANAPFPINGSFAYSDRNNQLVLFSFVPLAGLTGAKLAPLLSAFAEKANQWAAAVNSGTTADLTPKSTKRSDSLFNLKP